MPHRSLLGVLPPNPKLGIVEGFFGPGWSHAWRMHYAKWLPQHGYGFYLYAPKSDHFLRKHWALPWPEETLAQLIELAETCRANGLAFGVGISPMNAHHDYEHKKAALRDKIRQIDELLKPDWLAVLFDDMPSDTPNLAAWQVRIAHDIAGWSNAPQLLFCPSYYSTDPILEKVFGAMPEGYLTEIGRDLDQEFKIFWTGEHVCSKSYPEAHLQQVAEWLQRKPFLWDNYPVNDGSKSSAFLHLKAFSERPATLEQFTSGHAVNPMKQAALSAIPLSSLPLSYALGKHYHPEAALHAALEATCGLQLAEHIHSDLALLQEIGLNQLSAAQIDELEQHYRPWRDHPCAAEILAWLAGDYKFDPECLTD